MPKRFITLLLPIILTALVLAAGTGCQAPQKSDELPPYKEIPAAELLTWIEDGREFQLVDVREEHEYNEAHIPGAKLLPLGQLKDNYQLLQPEDVIVLVCRSGRRSGEAAAFLAEQGYRQVYNLAGGMLGWHGPVTEL